MTYLYSDPERETDPHALPDVEVFQCDGWINDYDGSIIFQPPNDGEPDLWERFPDAWWYAYGQIGCLWDSDPQGPFASEEEALEHARDY